MFEKFSQSWALVKASASVLRSDKELLIFPALSAICSLIVIASFMVPIFSAGMFEHTHDREGRILLGIVTFAFYLVQYFVIIFFNSALVGAATIRLRGGDPTVGDGFRIAMSKLTTILGYAVISATVGLALRVLQDKLGWLGKIVVGMIGAAWTVATFMVVPVLVNQDVGPVEAIKRSVELLKKTWGENLIGNSGIGFVFFLIILAVLAPLGVLGFFAVSAKSSAAIITVVAVGVVALMLVGLVQAALQGIYAAALYRYAEDGEVGEAFDRNLIANAFRVKA